MTSLESAGLAESVTNFVYAVHHNRLKEEVKMKIALIGATGFVGSAILQEALL